MCFVSIIIPTFNRCTVLQRALNSIYRQSYTDYEVLVIDDGSTDGTAKMIEQLFPEVRYFYQSNNGVSASRNNGLVHAKADWLAFLDSDDEWLPDKLTKQMNEFQLNPDYKICHTEEHWIRNGVKVNQMKKHRKEGGWIFMHCLPLCAMSPSSIMIHRSVFEQVGDFDISLPACEDYDLWLRITAQYPVLFIEEPLILKYGGHEDQLSQKYWGMDRFRIQALQNIILDDILSENNKHKAVEMLVQKCSIFKQGALKRGKFVDAEEYQQIINKFQ